MKAVHAVLIAIVALFPGACAGPTGEVLPPKVTLVDIYPGRHVGLFEQQFIVRLRVGNSNNFDIPLDGLSFEMEVNGAPFASGLSDTAVTLPRLNSAVVAVTVSASSIDLVRQLLGLAESGSIECRIVGAAQLQSAFNRTVPFERTGRLDLIPHSRNRLAPRGGRSI